MNILVTGANGYLGRGVVKALLDRGNKVIATDLCTDDIDDRAEKVTCDLFAVEDPYVFFKKPEVVLHLAWRDGFMHYSDAHITDLPKHFKFINDLLQAGLKHISCMGSMHEVGFYEGSVGEDTPCWPLTPYGISKTALRELIQMMAKQNGAVCQWLRGYYIVGTDSVGNSVFSKIVSAAERGDEFFPFTMGLNLYDFIDYSDFCQQVASVVGQNKINGIIEICSGKPERLAERVERFISENGYKITLQYGAFPDRPYDSKAIWGNNSKIQEIMKGN